MSGSRTITTEGNDRLPNVHPGDILRHDFLIGSEIPLREVAEGAGISSVRLTGCWMERRGSMPLSTLGLHAISGCPTDSF